MAGDVRLSVSLSGGVRRQLGSGLDPNLSARVRVWKLAIAPSSSWQRRQSRQQAFQERSGSVPGPAATALWASQSGAVRRRTITVGAFERTYWLAAPPRLPATMMVVLHGMGLDGPRMASWTGLAERGPAAGLATVFPDGCREVWDDQGFGIPI